MLFAQVTDKGQEELKTAIGEAQNAKWYRRLKIIDLSAQGHRVPELAHLFDLGEASVRRYIKQYNEGGLANLQPGQSPGRHASIPLSKEDWEDLLAQRPSQFELLQTRARNWSQPLLQRYLYHYHQLEVAQGTISSTLKRQGISWKRAKKSDLARSRLRHQAAARRAAEKQGYQRRVKQSRRHWRRQNSTSQTGACGLL